jgi:AcrR family transcriptional regulator
MKRRTKKEAILTMAGGLFADKGYAATSMTEVAKLAGIAGATIFYHYKTKKELFVAVLESVKTSILREFSQYFAHQDFASGLEMLQAAIAFHLHLAETKKQWFLILHHHYTHELAVDDPVCRKHLVDIYECLVDIFEMALEKGQQDGSVRPLQTRKTALIILAMVDGMQQMENNRLYDAAALYEELLTSCRHMVQKY